MLYLYGEAIFRVLFRYSNSFQKVKTKASIIKYYIWSNKTDSFEKDVEKI